MRKLELLEMVVDYLNGGDAPDDMKGRFHDQIIKKYLEAAFNDIVFRVYIEGKNFADYSMLDSWARNYELDIQSGTHARLPYPPMQLPNNKGILQVAPKTETETIYCATTEHPRWNEDVTHYGVDAFNFRALPGGRRAKLGGYSFIGRTGTFWTTLEGINDLATAFDLQYANGNIWELEWLKGTGLSVRLVRDETIFERGLTDGTIIFNTYTGNDGKVYDGVKIGQQIWLCCNLKETGYNDGTLIPTGLDDAAWEADTNGAMAVYPHADIPGLDSEQEVIEAYGNLYNWYAVVNVKGLVNLTGGWHVPTDAEFTQLSDYIITNYAVWDADNVGNALKSCRQVNSPYYKTIVSEGGPEKAAAYRETNANAVFAALEVGQISDRMTFYLEQNTTGAGIETHVLWLDNIPTNCKKVLVKMVVPLERIDDFDEVMIPAGKEQLLMQTVMELLINKPPPDEINDQRAAR